MEMAKRSIWLLCLLVMPTIVVLSFYGTFFLLIGSLRVGSFLEYVVSGSSTIIW